MQSEYKYDYDKQRFLQSLREIIVACISWCVTGTTAILGIVLYGQFVVLVALLLPFTYAMMPHIMNFVVMYVDNRQKRLARAIASRESKQEKIEEEPLQEKQ